MSLSNTDRNSTIIKNSFFLLVKLLVKLFVSLYCSRLILKELGVVDYGIYNVVGGVVTLLSFLTGSLTSSTQRFLSYEIESNFRRLSKIFSMSINVYIIITLITIIISQTLGLWFIENKLTIPIERVDATFWVYQCSVISFIFIIFSSPYNALLIAYEKIKLYSYIGIFMMFVNLFLVLCLTLTDRDKLVVYSFLIVILSFISFIIPYIYVKMRMVNIRYERSFDKVLFKSILSFTGWSLYGNLSGVGFNQGISILLNIFFGPTVNAARSISNQINGALLGIAGNINIAANPQIIKSYSLNEKERMIQLVFSASKYSFLCLSFISLPIFINMDYILKLWLGDVPKYSAEFSTLVIVDGLVCGFSGSLMTSIQATGRIKYYQIIIGSILLMNIPLSYILLFNYGNVLIPFIVTIVLSFFAFNIRLVFVKKYLDISIMKYYRKVVFGPVISFLLSLLCVVYINNEFFLLNKFFIVNLFVSSGVSLFFIWFFGLDEKEKKFIKSKVYM